MADRKSLQKLLSKMVDVGFLLYDGSLYSRNRAWVPEAATLVRGRHHDQAVASVCAAAVGPTMPSELAAAWGLDLL